MRLFKGILVGGIRAQQGQARLFSALDENILHSTYKVRSPEMIS